MVRNSNQEISFKIIIILLVGLVIGILSSISSSFLNGPTLILVFLASIIGGIALLFLIKLNYGVHYALVLVLISNTIHRERFGIPIEVDAVAVLLLGVTLLLKSPKVFFNPKHYVLFIPIIGYLVANFAATFLNAPTLRMNSFEGISLFAQSLRQSLIVTYRAITFYLIIIAMQQHPHLKGRFPNYLIIFLLIHTVASLIAFIVYPIFPTPLVKYGQDGGTSLSINGFFLEPNLYAAFALSVIALMLAIALFSPMQRRQRLLMGIVIGLIGIILSYTRSVWVVFFLLLGCLIFIIFKSKLQVKRRLVNFLFPLGAIASSLIGTILLLSLFGFASNLSNRFKTVIDASTPSGRGRLDIWNAAFVQWQQSPWLGNGLLAFQPLVRVSPQPGWLYGSIIQTLHDSGIIGTIFMLWICIGCIAYTWHAYNKATTGQDKGILLGYLLAQIGLFFTSQFSSFFWGGFTWILMGLSVGHSLILLKKRQKDQPSTQILRQP